MSSRATRTCAALLVAHLLLAAASLATMDLDLDRGALRSGMNHAIDAYEWVGFGIFPLGIGLVTVALGAPLLVGALRRRTAG